MPILIFNIKMEKIDRHQKMLSKLYGKGFSEEFANRISQKSSINTFIYFKKGREYFISDIEFAAKTERTFDINVNDLATNEKLLHTLNLLALYADTESAVTNFIGYLSALSNKEGVEEKLLTNPKIRICIEDVETLQKVKEILNK